MISSEGCTAAVTEIVIWLILMLPEIRGMEWKIGGLVMSVLNKIACMQNRKDELPNQELAQELVAGNNRAGIKEIADNLYNENKDIQSDCIKVLYEAGYLKPEIIAEYAGDFLTLLASRNNRLVWGAMLALADIAGLQAELIYENLEKVYRAMKEGSVITVDNGVKVLACVAAHKEEYNKNIFPFLLENLRKCRPKELAQHAESIFVAVNPLNQEEFLQALRAREDLLSKAQLTRVKKLYKKLQEKPISGSVEKIESLMPNENQE
jgi:hypothetical protein